MKIVKKIFLIVRRVVTIIIDVFIEIYFKIMREYYYE